MFDHGATQPTPKAQNQDQLATPYHDMFFREIYGAGETEISCTMPSMEVVIGGAAKLDPSADYFGTCE